MYTLLVIACLGADPQGECNAFVSPFLQRTEEECNMEFVTQALPFFDSHPLGVIAFRCVYIEELEDQE